MLQKPPYLGLKLSQKADSKKRNWKFFLFDLPSGWTLSSAIAGSKMAELMGHLEWNQGWFFNEN